MWKYILIIIGFVILVGMQPVEAASKYKITPRVIDREVDQRDIFTETVSIENMSNHKVTIFPSVNAVAVDTGGDILDFVPASMGGTNATSVTSWITVSRAVTELAPGEKMTLPVSFRIHQDAAAGAYQAFIGFGTGRNRDVAEQQVRDGQAPGVIVTLSVAQQKTEFIKLDQFTVDRFVLSADNTAIKYRLHNPGETSITPSGEVILYNGRGAEVGAVPVNIEGISIAPGEEHQFAIPVPTTGFLGKYKAFLSVDYGVSQVASVYDTAYYYAIPWPKLLLLLVCLLVLAVVVYLLLHRRLMPTDEHTAVHLPLHVFDGTSEDIHHDINLKK